MASASHTARPPGYRPPLRNPYLDILEQRLATAEAKYAAFVKAAPLFGPDIVARGAVLQDRLDNARSVLSRFEAKETERAKRAVVVPLMDARSNTDHLAMLIHPAKPKLEHAAHPQESEPGRTYLRDRYAPISLQPGHTSRSLHHR